MRWFELFKSKNQDHRKSYLKELIKVAKADGCLEKREYDFILVIGQKLACSADEIQELSDEIQTDAPPQNRKLRLKLLFDTVAIMLIDGDIDPKELALCKSIAMKSGFEPEVIDDIVYRIERLTKSGKSVEEASNEAFEIYSRAE
ncbi:MAG: hypothetical protein DHS20C17_18460 [Cyclobacteriaceae bacterium]|nr:MAG: hypothetical protein DHS20C17_18460 [Cyclobacteriaceae bacterium]